MTTKESDMTMERATADPREGSTGYKTGWWILVLLTGLTVVGHLLGPFSYASGDDPVGFFALAAMGIYALGVLFFSYRRAERWAWGMTWVLVAMFAVTGFEVDVARWYYLGIAGLMTVAQAATWPAFQNR